MKSSFPRIVIAGLKGGSGKTTLSLGLIAAWRRKGRVVVPYKKGPDYIDAGWLSSAAGRLCYNLDPFLIGQERIMSSFREHFQGSDCAVIEGNRGLYDGMDSAGTYSTAELSKILKSPVVIIMDCTKVTRTAGAMILGMQKFDKRVDIKGVVLNRIAGARHEKIIREAIERYCKVRVVGAIPKLDDEVVSERHMGLTSFQEHPDVEKAISAAGDIAVKYIDLDAIWDIAKGADSLTAVREMADCVRGGEMAGGRPLIGVIRDSAFQFYYPENIEELVNKGAIIREVSALTEKQLPENLDALYIGGGFPETNAIALAKNVSFRKSVLSAVENGLPVYAECGGLMYLGEALLLGAKKYPMAGVFPITFCLEKKPQAHGYTVVEVFRENPFYPRGTVLKGHEFHYSRVVEFGKRHGVTFSFMMKRGQGIRQGSDGVCYRNVLATYTHLHAYGAPEWAEGLVRKAGMYKKEKGRGVTKRKDNKADRRP
jgi:cobyrinic acid a,c-diamide synthase